MSIDYYSRLIVGIPLKDVYSEKIITKSKTKYNENTGAAVKKQIEVLSRNFNGKPLPDIEVEIEYSCKQLRRDFDFIDELEFYTPRPDVLSAINGDYFMADGLIGLEVASTTYESGTQEVNSGLLVEITDKVNKILKKIGVELKAKLYTQLLIHC